MNEHLLSKPYIIIYQFFLFFFRKENTIFTKKSIFQTDYGFAVKPIALLDRVNNAIGDTVIHGRQTCGIHISQPVDLQWRRFEGKYPHSIMGSMTGEIDENIDLIGVDLIRQICI